MKTKDFLAVIFCLLIGCKHVQVSGDTYDLKYNPGIFDDQYIGCGDELNNDIMPRILRQEKANRQFGDAWKKATNEWNELESKLHLPDEFEDEYGIALLVFTNQIPKGNPIYQQLNANLTIAGASVKDYMDKFHFKALHFYLTRALQILKPECGHNYTTFRGSQDTFKASPLFKFGRFTSTSQNFTEAKTFGTESFFMITTCFGAKIGDFSFFPEEDEILIPPTEKFTYVKKSNSAYILESTGQVCSYFNCAIMGGEKQREAVCYSELMDNGNIKKKVSGPPAEQEDRISALEDLTIRNHEEWNSYRNLVLDITKNVFRHSLLFWFQDHEITLLQNKHDELNSLCKSIQYQYSLFRELVQQKTNLTNMVLEIEMVERKFYQEKIEENLNKLSTKMDNLQEMFGKAKNRLQVMEAALQNDKMRVTDAQDTNSQNLKMVKILQKEISALQVSRDELQAAVYNIRHGLKIAIAFGIPVLVYKVRLALR